MSGPLFCLSNWKFTIFHRGIKKSISQSTIHTEKKIWEGFGLFHNQLLLWNHLVALMRCTRQVKLGSESELLHYQELLESFRRAIQNLWQVKISSVLSAPEKVKVESSVVRESHEANRSNFHLFSSAVLISAVVCAAYKFILTLGCCIKPLCHMGGLEQKNTFMQAAFKILIKLSYQCHKK